MLPLNGFDITADYLRTRAHREAELYCLLREAGVQNGWDRLRDLFAETLISGGELLQRFGCWMSSACAKSPEPATSTIRVECS